MNITPSLSESKVRMANRPSFWNWNGPMDAVEFEEDGIRAVLQHLNQPVYILDIDGRIGLTNQGEIQPGSSGVVPCRAVSWPVVLDDLGDAAFKGTYGTKYAYACGSMAQGISSAELVIALGNAGMLGSFGAAGMVPPRLEAAIQKVQAALPDGPYAFNLIHSPHEEAMERNAVDLYLRYGVKTVEASAFLDLTPSIVRYRAAGLSVGVNGEINVGNRVIAKLSRTEVAQKFMQPAPARMLNELVQQGKISPQQANWAQQVPMADDVTVEADSGGHTDNRPLVCLVPTMLALRDELQAKYKFSQPVRVGAAGGISTPASVFAAFMMGAAYVVTGSANQACVEAGTSEHTRKLLALAGMADVMMAPSADMFEMGVKVQVLKKGTLFPMRAQKLYEMYTRYDSIDAIPADEREKVEKQVFRRGLESIWQDTVKFFEERDPEQIERANQNPKRKMALIFRWYLGLSSKWSNSGEPDREMDYQIWCGPAMGTFNDWTRGTYLAEYQNRRAVDVGLHLLSGAAYLWRLQSLKMQGLLLPSAWEQYRPVAPLI
jgi:trans-AT polyketide synthase/acyltransferase/oxidoreductase domain-containing protein